MSGRDFNDGIHSSGMDDYIPAVFARTPEEAEEYCQILEDHDIPAVVDEEYDPARKGGGRSVAVLVPESRIQDARAFIAEMKELQELADEDELDVDEDEEGEQDPACDAEDDDLEEDEEGEDLQPEEKKKEEKEEEEDDGKR